MVFHCVCVCVCVYVCVCVCTTSFLIHLSVDGRLGFFHVLAIVNSAALNIGVHTSFQIIVFLSMCPGVELLDHMATLILVL